MPPVSPSRRRSRPRQAKADAAARPRLKLQIHHAGQEDVSYLRRNLLRAHVLLGSALQELSLALVGDERMSELHRRHLGITGPTDVLSFELDRDPAGRVIGGEVVVCVPEARRQARARGSSVEREMLLYALHGLLHLSGFDDRTAAGFRAMHRTEDDILTRLGVGPVFRGATRRRAGKRGR